METRFAPAEAPTSESSKPEFEDAGASAPSTATLPSDVITRRRSMESATLDAPAQNEATMLRDAESPARAQEGAAREVMQSLSSDTQTFNAQSDADAIGYCSEEETASPATWIACILRLQQEGMHDEARFEHDRLHETFPGAEVPPLTAPLPDSP